MACNRKTLLRKRYRDLCWTLQYRSWHSAAEIAYIERNLRWIKKQLGHTPRLDTPVSSIHPADRDLGATEQPARTPHKKGYGATWTPTRARYWCTVNNNWKQHGKLRKQWMKHL